MRNDSRRDFLRAVGLAAVAGPPLAVAARQGGDHAAALDAFFVKPDELNLRFAYPPGARRLSFAHHPGPPDRWRRECRAKLGELIGYAPPAPAPAERIRSLEHEGVTIEAWVMHLDGVDLPAYLLVPPRRRDRARAVMAIHGHGAAEPCCGLHDDYHHRFALRLAQDGHLVLCPELRGFSALADMCHSDPGRTLDYWQSSRGHQFTLVSDAFLYGKTVIGQTVEDLVRWEQWLRASREVESFDVAGISYGGDLVITYPPFSRHVRKMYCSGSMGSIAGIFARCYNAPAHGIPHVLRWMDRSDVAGLSAPTPLRLHYGELDTPGPHNASASYNESVRPALEELRAIHVAFGASPENVTMRVTPETGHEFEIDDLLAFLAT